MVAPQSPVIVQLPAGWTAKAQPQVLYAALGPKAPWGQPNYVITGEPAKDVKLYAQTQLSELKAGLQKFSLLKETTRKVAAYDGVWREHTFELNGKQAAQIQFYVAAHGTVYILTYTCDPKALDSCRPDAERLIAVTSFKK